MVRAAKRAIYTVLGQTDVDDEELTSVIVGVEGLLNSQPLTYQTRNVDDYLSLTPCNFLVGLMEPQFAPENVDTENYSYRAHWRHVQGLIRDVWDRWMAEWLPSLSTRKKWHLVFSPDQARGRWPMGRIVEIYPGADGHTRAADVKVGGQMYRRPIVKLCPLDV